MAAKDIHEMYEWIFIHVDIAMALQIMMTYMRIIYHNYMRESKGKHTLNTTECHYSKMEKAHGSP